MHWFAVCNLEFRNIKRNGNVKKDKMFYTSLRIPSPYIFFKVTGFFVQNVVGDLKESPSTLYRIMLSHFWKK